MSSSDGWRRERLLLGSLAGVFLAQFLLYGAGIGLCAWHAIQLARDPACPELLQRLNTTFDTAITAALALLGGAGASSRRPPEP